MNVSQSIALTRAASRRVDSFSFGDRLFSATCEALTDGIRLSAWLAGFVSHWTAGRSNKANRAGSHRATQLLRRLKGKSKEVIRELLGAPHAFASSRIDPVWYYRVDDRAKTGIAFSFHLDRVHRVDIICL